MGQGVSKRKRHGSLTLGYMADDAVPARSRDPFSNTDLLLGRPEWYGLGRGRIDSGRCSTSNDLEYIDANHYCDLLREQADDELDPAVSMAPKLTMADAVAHSSSSMHELVLYCQSLTWLHPNLSLLSQLQKLDLSGNYLTQLPDAIGSLQRLEVLHLQHNELRSLPDTLGYLTHLKELDVSFNKLQSVTPYIGHLRRLETFQLLGNALLTQLPTTLGNLTRLVTLSVANCPRLESLPAEILGLNGLRHLRVAESHALQAPLEAMNLAHTPPSLVELCARRLYPEAIPAPAFRDRHHAQPCSACGRPYFETFVSRLRLVEKAEVIVRVEYKLCSAHWNTEDDRLLYTFSAAPTPSHITYPLLPLPPLPTPSKQKRLSLHHIKNSRPYRFKRPAAAKAP